MLEMLIKLLFSLVHRKKVDNRWNWLPLFWKWLLFRPTQFNLCILSFWREKTESLQPCSCNWWNILLIGFFKNRGPHYLETFYNKLILARRVWDSHESARLSLNKGDQGSISAPCLMWVEFVAGSHHALMVSHLRALRISSLSSTKTNISNSTGVSTLTCIKTS